VQEHPIASGGKQRQETAADIFRYFRCVLREVVDAMFELGPARAVLSLNARTALAF
jgi:hypothetical protein